MAPEQWSDNPEYSDEVSGSEMGNRQYRRRQCGDVLTAFGRWTSGDTAAPYMNARLDDLRTVIYGNASNSNFE